MGMGKNMKSYGFGPKIKNYVFSRQPREAPLPTFEFVNEPVKQFAQRLRARPGKNIWMMGGGEIIASFLDAGEIDEFRIHVIPILIGEGIPLIQLRHRSIRLKLLAAKATSNIILTDQLPNQPADPLQHRVAREPFPQERQGPPLRLLLRRYQQQHLRCRTQLRR